MYSHLCSQLPASPPAAKTGGDAKKKYTVGICNYVDDASLNQIVDNIKKQLASVAAEKGVEIEVKYDNCNGDSVVMNQIISNFIVDKVDLMVGVATPVAIAMQAAVETENSDIPVVFSAVSDPLGSKLCRVPRRTRRSASPEPPIISNTNAIMDLILLKDPDMKESVCSTTSVRILPTNADRRREGVSRGQGRRSDRAHRHHRRRGHPRRTGTCCRRR